MKQLNELAVAARGDREIVMTREFNAPRGIVFRALTEPELVKRWLYGPEGWSLAVCEIDLRVGGTYRYLWRHTNGQQMGAGGVFREIAAPERLVQTERFDEAWYPGESLITTVLTEHGGRTTFTATLRYESRAARDGVLRSPMEDGAGQSYERLAQIVASLAG